MSEHRCARSRRAPTLTGVRSSHTHRPKDLPVAVRELLPHGQHGATNLLRLTARRFDNRCIEGAPLDCPPITQEGQIPGFRNITEHLESWPNAHPAFVALSNGLLSDFGRPAWGEANRIIGPRIRQRHRIS